MPKTDDSRLQTLVIGIDGASMNVLSERPEGTIPTIRDIFETGVSGPLESQTPPWTPSAWPSMYTGVNPGKHGVYSFLRFEGYDWDVVNATDVKERTIWELLSERGHSSVVVNAPVTHPSNEFDGALVPGYLAPEDPQCHPQGLLSDIRSELGEYRLYNDDIGPEDTEQDQIDAYEELVTMRGEAFRYLADRYDPEFGFLQFQQTDTLFHESPENDDIVDAVYAAVDDQISQTLDACDPDVVFLVSDHGLGPYNGHEFRVNSFLRDEGYVQTVTGEGGMPSWNSIARNRLQNGEDGGTPDPSATERLLQLSAKAGLTSQRIESLVSALGVKDLVIKVAPVDAMRAASERVDFAESAAYFRDRVELGVRLNLAGREPNGVVPEADYETTRREIIEALSAVETPDGDPVFDDVLPREEVFHGPYVEDAPDIVTIPADYDQFLSASLRGAQFGEPSEPWNHKLHGIFAVDGAVDTDAEVTDAHLLDIAPSVLSTMDEPMSDRMDGTALSVVEPPEMSTYEEYHPYGGVETADGDMEDRLSDLGYLEQ
jgi:predicted AlkP superfamily phosphohydrolase/phosphomutase